MHHGTNFSNIGQCEAWILLGQNNDIERVVQINDVGNIHVKQINCTILFSQ